MQRMPSLMKFLGHFPSLKSKRLLYTRKIKTLPLDDLLRSLITTEMMLEEGQNKRNEEVGTKTLCIQACFRNFKEDKLKFG